MLNLFVRAGICAGLALSSIASAQVLESRLLVNTLRRPVFMTAAPGDSSRLYIVEKQGFIRILQNGVLQSTATPFLNIDAVVGGGTSSNSEQGLLGLAFHPDYQTNGRYFVYYTNNSNHTTLVERSRSTANPDLSSTTSRTILTINRTATNHLGGWIGFGPDGFLYIASGDSGGGCDPSNVAQNANERRGKILRINVDADDFPADANENFGIVAANPFAASGGNPAIWLTGLRNPWRPSFDRATGDFYIADVGQSQREEINFVAAGSASTPIRNFAWPWFEGDLANTCNKTGTISGTKVDPIHVYDHNTGCSVTGGYVYRGSAINPLRGTYFFADYCDAKIWSFRYTPSAGKTEFLDRTEELRAAGVDIGSIVSFAEDSEGEMYVIDQGSGTNGEIWKIVRACTEDLDNSSGVDDADFVLFAGAYSLLLCSDPSMPAGCPADFNRDGNVDDADFVLFADAYDTLLCP
jgi:glucose/arabinose dehydrogenase